MTSNILYIDARTFHEKVNFERAIEGLRAAHKKNAPLCTRALLESEGKSFLVLPAWQEGQAAGAKLVTIFPDNTKKDIPSIQGVYILFDGVGGQPLALIDGEALTFKKTAGDSALASQYLSKEDSKTLLMVGAGDLAPWLIEGHKVARPGISEVLVWNRTKDKAQKLAKAAGGVAVDDLDEAVARADIISCATAAKEPIIKGKLLKPGCHLDLVGGFTHFMRESDDDCIKRADVYVDSRWFTVEVNGDICQPIEKGLITADDIKGDLFDLAQANAKARTSKDGISLFKNGGGAHLDLMTASLVLDEAR